MAYGYVEEEDCGSCESFVEVEGDGVIGEYQEEGAGKGDGDPGREELFHFIELWRGFYCIEEGG